jgi:peptidoglycan/xylan/chitin deacetylase (PgdA/CDA1 family)
MKLISRISAAICAYGGPNAAWSAAVGARRLPVVLTYHRVLSDGDVKIDRTQRYVTENEFKAQIEYLLRRRNPVPLIDVVAGEIGDGSVFAVTFDDGYGDNYRTAAPILKESGVPASIFVTTDPVSGRGWLWWDRLANALTQSVGKTFAAFGRDWTIRTETDVWNTQAKLTKLLKRRADRDDIIESIAEQLGVDEDPPSGLYSTWDGIRALRNDGWEVGAHTKSHRILTSIPREDAFREINESADEIENETGTRPRLFAYPNGRPEDFDGEIISCLKKAGFVGAVAGDAGPEKSEIDPFAVKRIGPKSGEPRSVFLIRLSGLYYRFRRL